MDYFRALVHKQEISERMFELTNEVIQLLCGNYTAW